MGSGIHGVLYRERMEIAIALTGGYLLGSLTPGLWIARLRGIDIRRVGSGNIGSTNVYRVMGLWAGLIVQVVDIGKSMLAAYLAQRLGLPVWAQYLTVTAAVIGHMYPVWAGFQGGKGINTLLGGMLLIEPLSAGAALGTFLLVLSLTRIVSISSLTAVGSFLLWHGIVGESDTHGYLYGTIWWGLVIYSHRANIARLLAGTESRIGERKR